MHGQFQLTEDQLAIREVAQRFTADQITPHAAEWDEKHIFPRETIQRSAELGFGAIYVSEQSGGIGLGRLEAGGVLVDTQAPVIAVTNPAAGSVVASSITVEAAVTDASGIGKVEFYLDGKLMGTRTSAPYTQSWNTDATTDGEHTWRVVATDIAGRTSELSRPVMFSRAPVAPDTEGPVLSDLRAAGVALAAGATFGRDIALSLKASDRSGVSRVEWLLDGVVVSTASGSDTGPRATAELSMSDIAGASTWVVSASWSRS